MRFNHPGARLIDFSPDERYIVTFSPQFAENDDPKDPKVCTATIVFFVIGYKSVAKPARVINLGFLEYAPFSASGKCPLLRRNGLFFLLPIY